MKRKRSTRSLRSVPRGRDSSSRSLLKEIVESSEDAIFVLTLSGKITSWNRAAEKIFGYTTGEMIGASSSVLLPPDRRDEIERFMGQIRRGLRVEHFETTRIHRNGQRLILSVSVSPVRNSRGGIIGASTIARDITAERKLEAELLEAGERERQRIGRDLHDGLGQQLYGMSLVCRTLARALRRQKVPEAADAALLSSQLGAAIRQTRALARGLTPVMDTPNGLMLAMESFTAATRALFRVHCSFICEEPVLITNHSAAIHLFRIAQEAVSNAIRHGRARRISITLHRKSRNLALEVRDDGHGLSDQPATMDGMGLRIMRYRASMLGGSLHVANTLPRGASLTASVPLTQLSS